MKSNRLDCSSMLHHVTGLVAVIATVLAGLATAQVQVSPPTDYVRRASVWPRLQQPFLILGDRLEVAGKERISLAGTVSRGALSSAIVVVWELPGKLRLEETDASGLCHVCPSRGDKSDCRSGICAGRAGDYRDDPLAMPKTGLWLLFVFKGKAFVPTMAKTEAGFYMGVEPIDVVDLADKVELEKAIIAAIQRGNPSVPTPPREGFPEPILKYAKVRSIAAFEKQSKCWKLSFRDNAYLIAPYRLSRHGGSEEDTIRTEAIPDDIPLEKVVRRLIERAAVGA